MTRRSIQAGKTPLVIIRGGMDVQVEGWDDELVLASAEHKGGLKLERRSQSAVGHVRARAKLGDRVLFDWNTDLLGRKNKNEVGDAVHVEAGGDILVRVPTTSTVQVYAGGSAEVREIRGSVTVYATEDVRLRRVHAVVHASAGRALDLECETLTGDNAKFSAGRDLRFYILDLDSATISVDDLGGYWEGIVGEGARQIRLQAGGDVSLVTDQAIRIKTPDQLLGPIETPSGSVE